MTAHIPSVRSFCLGLILSLTCTNSGDSQTENARVKEVNHDIGCTIQIERQTWDSANPSVVTGKLENLSEGALDISVVPVLYLRFKASSAQGLGPSDGYWAPVDLLRGGPLGVDKHSIGGHADSIRPRPIRLKLAKKGDMIEFRVDAQNLLWAREISSVWPSEKFFVAVSPGEYDVQVVLETDNGDDESQKLAVVVDSDKRQRRKR
jgi:hypothetical protein